MNVSSILTDSLRKSKSSVRSAFSHKPFAVRSGTGGSGSAGSTPLLHMRNPSEMSPEELGFASVAAAREQLTSLKFWGLISKRAVQLGTSMEPREISLVLNGMSRTRTLSDHLDMVKDFSPIIERKIAYFSSAQIAMVLSALAKSFTAAVLPPDLISTLLREVKSRVHEFSTAVELSMVLNALAKLGVVDAGLAQRLSAIIHSKMRSGSVSFHARELCVVASALSQMGVRDVALYELIQSRVAPVLGEATPVEISRLVAAFAKAGVPTTGLLEATVGTCGDKFKYMSPSDLVNAVYGFGSVCEFIPLSTNYPLIELLNLLKRACIDSLALFQFREIAAVLQSFSRWRISLSDDELRTVLKKLEIMSRNKSDSETSIVPILGSLWAISSSESQNELIQTFSTEQHGPVIKTLSSTEPQTQSDWQNIARAVDASLSASSTNSSSLLHALSLCVVNNVQTLDKVSRTVLLDVLRDRVDPDSDLSLVLRDYTIS